MVKRTKTYKNELEDVFGLPHDDSDLDEFIEEHEAHLKIDEHALEECLTQQVESYHAVSKLLSDEVSRRDAAKSLVKEVEARVDVELREEARVTSLKTTETEIASRRTVHADVVKANNAFLRLSRRSRMLEALKESFSQRAYILKDLCQLWIASYYSDSGGESTDRAVKGTRSRENRKRLNDERNR